MFRRRGEDAGKRDRQRISVGWRRIGFNQVLAGVVERATLGKPMFLEIFDYRKETEDHPDCKRAVFLVPHIPAPAQEKDGKVTQDRP